MATATQFKSFCIAYFDDGKMSEFIINFSMNFNLLNEFLSFQIHFILAQSAFDAFRVNRR